MISKDSIIIKDGEVFYPEKVMDTGPLITVTTDYAFKISADPNHKVMIHYEDKVEWIPLRNIKEGDVIVMPLNYKISPEDDAVIWAIKKMNDKLIIDRNFVKIHSPDEAITLIQCVLMALGVRACKSGRIDKNWDNQFHYLWLILYRSEYEKLVNYGYLIPENDDKINKMIKNNKSRLKDTLPLSPILNDELYTYLTGYNKYKLYAIRKSERAKRSKMDLRKIRCMTSFQRTRLTPKSINKLIEMAGKMKDETNATSYLEKLKKVCDNYAFVTVREVDSKKKQERYDGPSYPATVNGFGVWDGLETKKYLIDL
jgi:hypothetical protein